MSVQFGRWNFAGQPASREYLGEVHKVLSAYAIDGDTCYSSAGIDILYCPFQATRESRNEVQPHVSPSGVVLTWDGRLDNRSEILAGLGHCLPPGLPDVAIACEAYECFGTGCFSKFVGDWALSICHPRERLLILAKDAVGTRALHYRFETTGVTWSTLLEPLLLRLQSLDLDEEYAAGWLSFFPAPERTPYSAVQSVPPSCFVCIENGRRSLSRYWDFAPRKRIRYRSDAEYEEHFRAVFASAVGRRLRADRPVLAELSGGMDSSSIVSMADQLIATGEAETPRLDTVSYFDDSEPHLDERPFFTEVEKRRGQSGCHIDVGSSGSSSPLFEVASLAFLSTPGSTGGQVTEVGRQLAAYVESNGHRVILSGIGGDEVTGGVPTPIPELQDLLSRAQLLTLARQLKSWALAKREPWFHLLLDTARHFLPTSLAGFSENRIPAPWLEQGFVRRNRTAFQAYETGIELAGPLPSFQHNLNALDMVRRQIGASEPAAWPALERRYPLLDRSFLEFLFAIPRQQVVRPGERRSLMRRALRGVVPDKVLSRRRKAFVSRAPFRAIAHEWTTVLELSRGMVSASLGWVNEAAFSNFLSKARQGQLLPLVALMRTLYLELWLRHIATRRVGGHPTWLSTTPASLS